MHFIQDNNYWKLVSDIKNCFYEAVKPNQSLDCLIPEVLSNFDILPESCRSDFVDNIEG